tara:strand:- start:57693 stop:58598 length:906 start_codon:yes stop_codon:yes gene_type:complete
MQFTGRHILNIDDFTKEELLHVLQTANKMQTQPPILQNNIMASLFFEPSTRTRLSFESAMKRLGGSVIGFSDCDDTSLAKGESFMDTIKVIGGYCDVIVLRHPKEGSAQKATEATNTPIINGGDGSNQHPTQTFLDLYTIQKTKGRLDNLHIAFFGYLKYGRTVHSLATALQFFNVTMYFVSLKTLKMPPKQLQELKKHIECVEIEDINEVAPQLDVIYATRIQKERFQYEADFQKIKGSYKLDKTFLNIAKKDVKILHPLPRVGEIQHTLDYTPNAVYFQQAHYGIPIKKALLSLVLGKV